MPCTWSLTSLPPENKAAYEKITKVWAPSRESKDPFMIDVDKLAAEQAKEQQAIKAEREAKEAAAKKITKQEHAELEELQRMLASGSTQSKREGRHVALEPGPSPD